MTRLILIFAFALVSFAGRLDAADKPAIFSNTYGNPGSPALIFMHGGPGFNSKTFEVIAAQRLADSGLFVIVYDRRGCGRSDTAPKPQYTFDEAIADLGDIFKRYSLQSASLLSQNFGGLIAIKFAEQNPTLVKNLILNNTPLNYQYVYSALRKLVDLEIKKNPSYEKSLGILERLDGTDLMYHKIFMGQNVLLGYHIPRPPTSESLECYKILNEMKDPMLAYTNSDELLGFYNSSSFIVQDFSKTLARLTKEVKVIGIYGAQDGWFDADHHQKIKSILGDDNFKLFENSAYNVFMDEREKFVNTILEIVRKP